MPDGVEGEESIFESHKLTFFGVKREMAVFYSSWNVIR